MSDTFTYSGVPDVEPSTQAAGEFMRAPAGPDAFGQQAGQGFEAFGQNLLKTAQFYEQVSADNATNNYLERQNKLLYGDPHQGVKMGVAGDPLKAPDGGPVYNGGFFGLKGRDALEAQSATFDQLNSIIAEERGNLKTARARQQFDIDTRRFRAKTQAEMGAHADAEYKAYALSTYKNTLDQGLEGVSRVAGDDAASAQAARQVYGAARMMARINGTDQDAAEHMATQEVLLTRLHRLMVDNPPAADALFSKSGDILGSRSDYDSLALQVKRANAEFVMPGFVDQTVQSLTDSVSGQVGQPAAAGAPGAPGVSRSGARLIAPKGAAYDQIAQVGSTAGYRPEEVTAAQRAAYIESSGNPNAPGGGLFQVRGDIAGRTGLDTTAQTKEYLQKQREYGRELYDAGIQRPQGWQTYVMWQQGPAAGKLILTAPGDVSVVSAIEAAYKGDHERALRAIAGNIGIRDKAAAEARARTMTVDEFKSFWQGRFGGARVGGAAGGPSVGGPYPNVADAISANMSDLEERAYDAAYKQFPNNPDVAERAAQNIVNRLHAKVSQLDAGYKVASDIVENALVGDQSQGAAPPITMEELESQSPQVAQALEVMKAHNPWGYMMIEQRLAANARGPAMTYGSEFYQYFDRVTSRSTVGDAITDPAALNAVVGGNWRAPLTTSGAGRLATLIKMRSTPQGEAMLGMIGGFGDQMHKAMTFSDPASGVYDSRGETAFEKYMAAVLPQIEAAAKQGPQALHKLLDPNSPDYLGKASYSFMRSQAELLQDQSEHQAQVASQPTMSVQQIDQATNGMNDDDRNDFLSDLMLQGKLTKAGYAAWYNSHSHGGDLNTFQAPAPQAVPVVPGPYPAIPPPHANPNAR